MGKKKSVKAKLAKAKVKIKVKSKAKFRSEVKKVIANSISPRSEPTLKEQTLDSITAILKYRMHPRELNQAVKEIKVVLDTKAIVWGS